MVEQKNEGKPEENRKGAEDILAELKKQEQFAKFGWGLALAAIGLSISFSSIEPRGLSQTILGIIVALIGFAIICRSIELIKGGKNMQNVAFILIGLGVLALISWGVKEFFIASEIPLLIRIAAGAIGAGVLVLIGVVIKDRRKKAKAGDFKKVEK